MPTILSIRNSEKTQLGGLCLTHVATTREGRAGGPTLNIFAEMSGGLCVFCYLPLSSHVTFHSPGPLSVVWAAHSMVISQSHNSHMTDSFQEA